MARLLIQPGTPDERAVTLKPGPNTFGRGAGNDFIISDPSVSGSHCEIILQDDSVKLIDLGSTNGSFIGQEQVTEYILSPGSTFRLGNVQLVYEIPADSTGPGQPGSPLRIRVAAPAATASPDPVESEQPEAKPRGLRIAPMFSSGSAEPAATSDSPPAPPLAPYVVDHPLFCKFHPKSKAIHWCHQCGKAFCELCVSTRRDRDVVHHVCRACSSECVPVKADFTPQAPKSYLALVLTAFKYPLNGDGMILLISGTIFFAAIDFAKAISKFAGIIGLVAIIILTLFGTGYLFAYIKRIIVASSEGDERMPDWPDFTDWGSDIMAPFFQLLTIFVFCFGPPLMLLIFYGDQSWGPVAAIAAGLFGVVYFPMAVLAVSMFDRVGAMNPLLVIPSIIHVLLHYLVVILLSLVVGGMQSVAGILLPALVPLPLVPNLIGHFVGLYFLVVNIRVLGLLYYSNRRKLGWFKR